MRETFKNRVTRFWEEFSKEESQIRKMMDDKVEGEELLKVVDSILHLAFNNICFEIGISKDNKYELILTPEGNRVRLLQLHYWLRQAPKDLWKNWNFYSSKPALENPGLSISMFGIDLSAKEISLYTRPDNSRNKIDIDIYCPKLMKLGRDERYIMFFVFLDRFISEFYTIEYVGYVDFLNKPPKEKPVTINNLKAHIDQCISENNWTRFDAPGQIYTGYKMEPSNNENLSLREDVFSGYSACIPILNAYYSEENDIFDEYSRDGIIFGFLFFENESIPSDSIVSFRGNIEDRIVSETSQYGIADSLGGATGFQYSYIDFIIYDSDAFLPIARKILKEYDLKKTGYADFKAGAKPILL